MPGGSVSLRTFVVCALHFIDDIRELHRKKGVEIDFFLNGNTKNQMTSMDST
jgi:hypothetical protein